MPIFKSEPADPNELPRIVRDDLEASPQGASRKQQVIGSHGRTLAIQVCTQLRRHTGIFALERQDGDRIHKIDSDPESTRGCPIRAMARRWICEARYTT